MKIAREERRQRRKGAGGLAGRGRRRQKAEENGAMGRCANGEARIDRLEPKMTLAVKREKWAPSTEERKRRKQWLPRREDGDRRLLT